MRTSAETRDVWDNVLNKLESRLNGQIFDVWFRPVTQESCDNSSKEITLRSKSINRDWINKHYIDLVKATMHELALPEYQIRWVTEEDRIVDQIEDDPDEESTDAIDSESPSIIKDETKFDDIEPTESHLIKKYTFDSFVVGACNQFAHAASEAVAKSPGQAYNPMYIYGGVGLGKTHLMHATGHAIRQQNKHLRILYISAEKFMNELINAIRYDKTQAFRDKYRSNDVLLIDDIQFIAGKERTQEEFFHTFNSLYNDQKQIVISSDTPPKDIPNLEERLHSRFEWGLIVDIEPPDLETKVAILKRKAESERIDLPDDIAFFIANRVRSNVRELEGSLVRLVAMSSLRGLPISKMLAQDAMKDFSDSEAASVTKERIIRHVADDYGLSIDEIKSKSNARRIALPRQVAMYLCKRLTRHSFPEIGKEFGGKHHTTVMHSVQKIEKLVKEEQDFHKRISGLIDNLCS